MNLVVDTSVVIAVVTNEAHKERLVAATKGADLIAPASLHWEMGNALSAMVRRGRTTVDQARGALRAYEAIPIRPCDGDLAGAIDLCAGLELYAYDAYVIQCALKHRCPLLTLDRRLMDAAQRAGARVVEVGQ